MGIQVRESNGKGAVFFKINSKEGCFQQGSGENKHKFPAGNTDLVGTVVGFQVDENEYEGKKSEELRLVLADVEAGQPNQHVSFTIASEASGASGFALRLLGRLNAIDITKPITLRPWKIEKGEKLGDDSVAQNDLTGCTVYQDGNKIAEDYGDGITKLPDLPKQMVGKKEVIDKSPWDALLDKMLDNLQSRLKPAAAEGHVDADDAAEAAAAAAQQPPANERSGMRARQAA